MKDNNRWADRDHRWQIIEERRFMWHQEQLDRFAEVMGLVPGMTVADVGCGLGYLGWMYWKHFGDGGTYIGVDCSEKLMVEAEDISTEWAAGGTACFMAGDCYDVPLADGSVDVAMCQTLLVHIEFPEKALSEMVRITRPGGVVVCKDVNNITGFMKYSYSTVTEEDDIDDLMFWRRMNLIWAEGRRKLGHGDLSAGSRIPRLMHEAGLTGIRGFCNERIEFLLPPYEEPEQRKRIDIIRRFSNESTEKEKHEEREEFRKHYIAGGGKPDSFDEDYERLAKINMIHKQRRMEQMDKKTMYGCSGGSNFFCFIGRKQD